MVGNMKQSKNVLHVKRYVLSVKSLIIIQECVGVKSCMICNRKLMNLNLKTMTFLSEQSIIRAEIIIS